MDDKLNEQLTKIRANAFDLDADSNMHKEADLLTRKIKAERMLFELTERFDQEANKLRVNEEFMKHGKNEETRKALIELELAGTDHDKIGVIKLVLKTIASVEKHNETVMDLFFRDKNNG